MNNEIYWLWLTRIPYLGGDKLKNLLLKFNNLENLWKIKSIEELKNVKGIGNKTAENILNKKFKENLNLYQDYIHKNQIKLISISSKKYPKKLKQIYNKPIALYVKGNEKILNDYSIAIIGCRAYSTYGKEIAIRISQDLAKEKITTVSGLAIGIDAFAHYGTICGKGKTIAVIGSGIDRIYPKQNTNLAIRIIEEGGAIVTEYPPGTPAYKSNFPARNRIISGLSNGVLVIEAKKHSGTMITVDFALEQGKEIYAVPGNVNSGNAQGTNELIKEGAKMVTNAQDILFEINK